MSAAPFLADPLPGPAAPAARVVAAVLGGYLLIVVLRDTTAVTRGSLVGLPAETLAAAAAFVVGYGTNGLRSAPLGPAAASASGFALAVIAVAPIVRGADVFRLGVALASSSPGPSSSGSAWPGRRAAARAADDGGVDDPVSSGTAAVLCVNGVAATSGLALRNEPRRSGCSEAHPISADGAGQPPTDLASAPVTGPSTGRGRPTDAHRVGPTPASPVTTSDVGGLRGPDGPGRALAARRRRTADRPTSEAPARIGCRPRRSGWPTDCCRRRSGWPTSCRRRHLTSRPAGTRGVPPRGAVHQSDPAVRQTTRNPGRPAAVTLIPFLAIAFGARRPPLIVRRYRRLSLAIGLLDPRGDDRRLAIVPGDRLAVGPGRLETTGSGAVPRPRLLDRSDHGRGRARHGLSAQPCRRPCSAGFGALGLALSIGDSIIALVAILAGALVGSLVTLTRPVTAGNVQVASREFRAIAVAGAMALVGMAWIARPLGALAEEPTVFGLAYLAVALAAAIRFGEIPFHRWAARLSDSAPEIALPLLLAWAPAGFAVVALAWMDRSIAPLLLPLEVERAVVLAVGVWHHAQAVGAWLRTTWSMSSATRRQDAGRDARSGVSTRPRGGPSATSTKALSSSWSRPRSRRGRRRPGPDTGRGRSRTSAAGAAGRQCWPSRSASSCWRRSACRASSAGTSGPG